MVATAAPNNQILSRNLRRLRREGRVSSDSFADHSAACVVRARGSGGGARNRLAG